MSGDGKLLTVEMVPLREIVETLRGTHPFAESSAETLLETLAGVKGVERVRAQAGTMLVEPEEPWRFY